MHTCGELLPRIDSPDIRGQRMASHVEAELIRIKKDNLKGRSLRARPGEGSACKLSFVHVQSKAYYFRDMARLNVWCTSMIGGCDNVQLEGRWASGVIIEKD